MHDLIDQLENDLIQAQTLDDCKKALAGYLKKMGIGTFSFTYYAYHPHSASQLKYDMCSDNFKSWHQHYLQQQYNHIDSTLQFVYHNHLPIYWSLQNQLSQAKTETERQMRHDSIAFGAIDGLSIPIHGPHNNFAILVVVQMKGDDIPLKTLSLQRNLLLAAHQYYHYLQTHLLDEQTEVEAYNLSQRETQCLVLIAQQLSVQEIAQRLEISQRTVNFHIQNLNKKLGTNNKYQSVNKALALKLLTL